MDFKEFLQFAATSGDLSYAALVLVMAASALVAWGMADRSHRRRALDLMATVERLEATVEKQAAKIRGQEATIRSQIAAIEELEQPIGLSKETLWAVEYARLSLEKSVEDLTRQVSRIYSKKPPPKESVEQASSSATAALAELKNAGMNVLEVFYGDPDTVGRGTSPG